MFWSGEKIALCFPAENIIDQYDKSNIDCNSYQLRIGDRFYITNDVAGNRPSNGIETFGGGGRSSCTIPSGHFAFLETKERLSIPKNVMGFITLKTRVAKFKGLVNISGFHVDPGYNGPLVYAVFNAGPAPIVVEPGQVFFSLWIADIDTNLQRPTVQSNYFIDKSGAGITAELVSGMSAPLGSLQDFSTRMSTFGSEIASLKGEIANLRESRDFIVNTAAFLVAVCGVLAAIRFGA